MVLCPAASIDFSENFTELKSEVDWVPCVIINIHFVYIHTCAKETDRCVTSTIAFEKLNAVRIK